MKRRDFWFQRKNISYAGTMDCVHIPNKYLENCCFNTEQRGLYGEPNVTWNVGSQLSPAFFRVQNDLVQFCKTGHNKLQKKEIL